MSQELQNIIVHQASVLLVKDGQIQQLQQQSQQFFAANQTLAAKYKKLQELANLDVGHELYVAFPSEPVAQPG